MRPGRAASLGVLLGVALAAPAAGAPVLGQTTVQQTVHGTGAGPLHRLALGRGEPYIVRTGAGADPRRGRARRRVSLAYFGQLTDFQLSDEESPGRVENLDSIGGPLTAAWRPHEALIPWVVDASIRQVDAFYRSPVRQAHGRRAHMDLVVTTGDSADNQQRNETEWVRRLLEGGRLDPNSGSSRRADYEKCPAGTPGRREAKRYTGVQDYGDGAPSRYFYDPDRPSANYPGWPRYPGLMDRAQRSFVAAGLRVPSYAVFGNHDGLVQGNAAATEEFDRIATGCVKGFGTTGSEGPARSARAAAPPLPLGPHPVKVPPDPERRFVSKREYKDIFKAGRQPDGHGFDFVDRAEERGSRGAAGYYAWTPKPGVRFVVLDAVAEAGVIGADGNIDNPQYRWLERQLKAATARDELIVLFSHHPLESLTNAAPDERAPPCLGRSRRYRRDRNAGCDVDPRDSRPIRLEADLRALLLRYPHVIAWVAGHWHVNRVVPHSRPDGHGFWTIQTAAEADWPVQERLIEIMDNEDGTLSLFGTVLDIGAPIRAPRSGTSATRMPGRTLAAIARTFAFNDPQIAHASAEGQRQDRNVELLVPDPRRPPLAVRVRPGRVVAGRRVRFAIRVTSRGRAVAGARVSLAGHRARTDAGGHAALRLRLDGPRRYRVRAMRAGFRAGADEVHVRPR
jgi:metallophosphoesterase (TIGR03767 family)